MNRPATHLHHGDTDVTDRFLGHFCQGGQKDKYRNHHNEDECSAGKQGAPGPTRQHWNTRCTATHPSIYFNQACSSHPISRLVTRKPECKQELKAFVKRCETRPGREPRKYLSAMTLAIILQTVHIADIQTVFLSCPGESCTNSVYL